MDHALAPREGTLVRVLVPEGSCVNDGGASPPDFGAAIAEIEFCPHSVVYQGLCAVCGEEAVVDHFANVTEGPARLPVAYNAQTLSVTRAEAESVASVTTRQLLKERRLLLVLDLDHTLVHASDDPRAAAVLDHSPEGRDVSSVASFSLSSLDPAVPPLGRRDSRMHLKLRPHLAEFLSRCAELFELHIYTMGSRPYADRVAELIDPDKRLFSGRITSREDFEEGRSNQKNISRLFPCDDSMVLIIDDREDVWVSGTGATFMPNLIRAKPYTFFNGLHEAYDRALLSGGPVNSNAIEDRPAVTKSQGTMAVEARDPAVVPVEALTVSNGRQDGTRVDSKKAGLDEKLDEETSSAKTTNGDGPLFPPDGQCKGQIAEPMPMLSDELRKLVCQWWENDTSAGGWNNHLQRLADVLEMCHSRFFSRIPTEKKKQSALPALPLQIPADVKTIVADIRAEILKGCVLTFTGVIPLTTAPEESSIWELATRHGALCRREFVLGETTHVIASAERGVSTEKTKAAVDTGTAFVVDVSWLDDSTMQFERRPELPYNLKQPVLCSTSEEHRATINANFALAAKQREEQLAAGGTRGASAGTDGGMSADQMEENVGGHSVRRQRGSPREGSCPPRKRRKVGSRVDRKDEGDAGGMDKKQRLLDAKEADEAIDEAFDF
jgi:RNA polymerase II subunit A C-terminal domain phosphatase